MVEVVFDIEKRELLKVGEAMEVVVAAFGVCAHESEKFGFDLRGITLDRYFVREDEAEIRTHSFFLFIEGE